MDLTGSSTATLANGFPTGFSSFYCMKYEMSQSQYVDFLNSLTAEEQFKRTAGIVESAPQTGALVAPNNIRNGIDLMTQGNRSLNRPAVYANNLSDNTVYNSNNDGQWVACNYLSWMDGCAYMDWAGLRPMTELEFEKACRGIATPVPSEFPWGTSSIVGSSVSSQYGTSNLGRADEAVTIATFSTALGNAIHSYTDFDGPARVGIFASNTNNWGRLSAGASYYGIMELGGNLSEQVVTIGNIAGRSFTGKHGNGMLNYSGDADVDYWPGINDNSSTTTVNSSYSGTNGVTKAAGAGLRGGSYPNSIDALRISNRESAILSYHTRSQQGGFRGVRSVQ